MPENETKTTASGATGDTATLPVDGPIARDELIAMALDMQRAIGVIDRMLKDAGAEITFADFAVLQKLAEADAIAGTVGAEAKPVRVRPPQRRTLTKLGFIAEGEGRQVDLTDSGRDALARGNAAFDAFLGTIQSSGRGLLTRKRAHQFSRTCNRLRHRPKVAETA